MSLNTFSPHSTDLHREGLPKLSANSSAIVVGAGAFGGWTALYLLRKGLKVTLVDGWGAGNTLGSSGDESRIIRATYGKNEFYSTLCLRALELWKEHEKAWKRKLFHNTGMLWFCYEERTPLLEESIPFMETHGLEYTYLSQSVLNEKYPLINSRDIHHAYLDASAGFLKAKESCLAVMEAFVQEGGEYIEALVKPGHIVNGKITELQLRDGSTIRSDAYVFACGSWLGQIFPEVLGNIITCSKQEVFYFGLPKKINNTYASLPVWVDVDGKDFYYGIPGEGQHAFKIGVDKRGATFDPTNGLRAGDPEVLKGAQAFLAHRFPGLVNTPLLSARVCPYENSPDGNFLFDRHPEAENVIFLGGGSGHGFKHGPALGEFVSNSLVS